MSTQGRQEIIEKAFNISCYIVIPEDVNYFSVVDPRLETYNRTQK